MHLVNSKLLLNKNTFIKLSINNYIKASIIIFLITSYKIYTFKNIFLNSKRNKTINLILKNIAIIKGFYINLILKARLR
jgi:hypothetical protein